MHFFFLIVLAVSCTVTVFVLTDLYKNYDRYEFKCLERFEEFGHISVCYIIKYTRRRR